MRKNNMQFVKLSVTFNIHKKNRTCKCLQMWLYNDYITTNTSWCFLQDLWMDVAAFSCWRKCIVTFSASFKRLKNSNNNNLHYYDILMQLRKAKTFYCCKVFQNTTHLTNTTTKVRVVEATIMAFPSCASCSSHVFETQQWTNFHVVIVSSETRRLRGSRGRRMCRARKVVFLTEELRRAACTGSFGQCFHLETTEWGSDCLPMGWLQNRAMSAEWITTARLNGKNVNSNHSSKSNNGKSPKDDIQVNPIWRSILIEAS